MNLPPVNPDAPITVAKVWNPHHPIYWCAYRIGQDFRHGYGKDPADALEDLLDLERRVKPPLTKIGPGGDFVRETCDHCVGGVVRIERGVGGSVPCSHCRPFPTGPDCAKVNNSVAEGVGP